MTELEMLVDRINRSTRRITANEQRIKRINGLNRFLRNNLQLDKARVEEITHAQDVMKGTCSWCVKGR